MPGVDRDEDQQDEAREEGRTQKQHAQGRHQEVPGMHHARGHHGQLVPSSSQALGQPRQSWVDFVFHVAQGLQYKERARS